MTMYPLGTLVELVESVSAGTLPMKVAYAYEDLVFMEHNAFLLQFTDNENEVLLHRNADAQMDELIDPILALKAAAEVKEINISEGLFYRIEQADGENLNIEFLPDAQ